MRWGQTKRSKTWLEKQLSMVFWKGVDWAGLETCGDGWNRWKQVVVAATYLNGL